MRLLERPLHVVDTAVAVVGDGVEKVLAQVEISYGAANAAVDNSGGVWTTIDTSDADLASAQRVGVWVAGTVGIEKDMRDSDNGVTWSIGNTTSTKSIFVPSQVTLVRSASAGVSAAG